MDLKARNTVGLCAICKKKFQPEDEIVSVEFNTSLLDICSTHETVATATLPIRKFVNPKR